VLGCLVETGPSRRAERRVRLDLDDPGDAIGLQCFGLSNRRHFERGELFLIVGRTDLTDFTVAHDVIVGPADDVRVHVMPENGLGLFAGRGLDDDNGFLCHVASRAKLPLHVGLSIGSEMRFGARAR
jgi:hypothetical protein